MSVVVESVAKKDGKSPDVKVSTYTKTLSSPRPSELSGGGSQKTQSREVYLEERARHLEMPTAEEAELTPKYLYDDPVFIMHMCTSCRSINRTLPAVPVDEEYQKIGGFCQIL
ncbi:hypothetical protein CRE_24427 [Caenorhabditis remanei]|uniref:Uncharacterized protein n=1 Tax=Caenorhabditis remanei TaxID=31234 RepID=E3MFZ2_CAERE|nr:hypothetical protein CRE_24427 [Caenorhabditis remanei]